MKSRQTEGGLKIPELKLAEKPWIPEREYTVVAWAPRYVRGAFVNPYADERMNVWLYSERQLATYTEMFDWFGFSGVQLGTQCYSFGLFGSVEAYQDRLKTIARLTRQNGQHVTLKVWAAQFTGYNWIDPEITYTP